MARDSILQKQKRRFLVSCAKFCGTSLLLQSIENEIFQSQTCKNNLKYDGACVVMNQDLSTNVTIVCNILKAVNAFMSCAAGVAMYFVLVCSKVVSGFSSVFFCFNADEIHLIKSYIRHSNHLSEIPPCLPLSAFSSPEFVGGAAFGSQQTFALCLIRRSTLRTFCSTVQQL